MDYQWTAIREGMDVRDIQGEKIGSVGKIHSTVPVGTAMAADAGTSASGNIIEVDTGFLGLGTNWYIPAEYISSVISDYVMLNHTKETLEDMGFDDKPDQLE